MAKATIISIASSISSAVKYIGPVSLSTVGPGEREITLEEVLWHDTRKDCWMIIYDRVYDITEFLDEHPGGVDLLLEYAGRDATVAFRGSGHSTTALKLLERYMIGELPVNERIFRKNGGFKLSDIPE
ncbi:hypothetical protein HHI36_006664 [Cryptolaemus montrouzieri]|uniref:Cytochrome b5 heme-binding domain-containing protein n=1 Tax=Cryptolaemus montrouzieri TaxID=559131 RepID=A0ABD2NY26_9CUCU